MAWPLQPQLRGEPQSVPGVGLGSDHDEILGGVVVQGAERGVEVVDRPHVPTEVRDQVVRRSGRAGKGWSSRCPHFFVVFGATGNSGSSWSWTLTWADGPSNARYGSEVWDSWIRRSASI